MSESFGECESGLGTTGNAFFNSLWEQAAAQGITVTIASGDPGSAGCDDFTTATAASGGLAVSGFASTPFNVAVGGTDFDDATTQPTFWSSTNGTWPRVRVRLHSRNPLERFLRGDCSKRDAQHRLPKRNRNPE